MSPTPKWFRPVAILALLWNLLGCVAYLADVMTTPEAVARMSAAEQAMYAARPAWAVAATATAVWFGFAGSLGLIMRKRWAMPLLAISLAGVVVQEVAIFAMSGAVALAGAAVIVLQSVVVIIAVALVMLARTASARGWLGRPASAPAAGHL